MKKRILGFFEDVAYYLHRFAEWILDEVVTLENLVLLVIVFIIFVSVGYFTSLKPAPIPLAQALSVWTTVGASECVVTVIQTRPASTSQGTFILTQANLGFRNPGRFVSGQQLFENNGIFGKKPYGFESHFSKINGNCSDLDLAIHEVNGN